MDTYIKGTGHILPIPNLILTSIKWTTNLLTSTTIIGQSQVFFISPLFSRKVTISDWEEVSSREVSEMCYFTGNDFKLSTTGIFSPICILVGTMSTILRKVDFARKASAVCVACRLLDARSTSCVARATEIPSSGKVSDIEAIHCRHEIYIFLNVR